MDIVLIDAVGPFGGGHLLPVGRLREPRSALARADMIVITRSDHAPAIEAALSDTIRTRPFFTRNRLDAIRAARYGADGGEIAFALGAELFAFCGIGNPVAFLPDLRDWGFQIVGHKFFRDHHRYMQDDPDRYWADWRKRGRGRH